MMCFLGLAHRGAFCSRPYLTPQWPLTAAFPALNSYTAGADRSFENRGKRIDFALDLKTNRRLREKNVDTTVDAARLEARHKTQSRHRDFHGSRVGHENGLCLWGRQFWRQPPFRGGSTQNPWVAEYFRRSGQRRSFSTDSDAWGPTAVTAVE